MHYEIEMKAWVRDRAAIERRISEIGVFRHKEMKNDSYFGHRRSDRLAFRVREIGNIATVTVKRKRVRQKMEVSEETEFSVSDTESFFRFAALLGYEPREAKRKMTDLFEVDGFSVELNHIEGLGDFVEIERLADSPEGVEMLRAQMIALFRRIGIAETEIEKRSYRELLEMQQRGDADRKERLKTFSRKGAAAVM